MTTRGSNNNGAQYGEYLRVLGGTEYQERVFAYVSERNARSLPFQLELMRQHGFDRVEVLHKHACFAAFGGIKLRLSA